MPVGDDANAPQRDQYDPRFGWWYGKRIFLGNDTRVARLFWLLAEHPGRPYRIDEVQRAVDGHVTAAYLGFSDRAVTRSDQRLRQTVSRLRSRMREAGVDDHAFILRENTARGPAVTMYRRFPG